MATIFGLPFGVTGWKTVYDGLFLGDTFFDSRGRQHRFYTLSDRLTGDATVVNDVMVIDATNTPAVPAGYKFDYTTTTGVTPFYTVTNTVANGVGYAAGAPVIALVAGICGGAFAEAASAAAEDWKGILCQTKGFHLVRGDGTTETLAGGNHVILGATAGYACGMQAALAGTDTTAETRGTQRSHIGWSVAADEDTDNLIACHVSIGEF